MMDAQRDRSGLLGQTCYRYQELDSTNVQAKRLAQKGAEHGTVVVAESQTAGRGRRGRGWSAPPGAGLWCSLLLRPEIPPNRASMVTLVAAMAAAEAIEKLTGLKPGIKWPNDVVLEGKKVCGILTEMSVQSDEIQYVIVGIGINIAHQEFPPELAERATSLANEWERKNATAFHLLAEDLQKELLERFQVYYQRYLATQDVSLFQTEYHNYLVNLGRQVTVLDPAGSWQGTARGINSQGELLVEREGVVTAVCAGEVSVRGIYGYV